MNVCYDDIKGNLGQNKRLSIDSLLFIVVDIYFTSKITTRFK